MPDQKENTSSYSPLQQTGRRRLRRILLTLTLLCLLNLLFTASIASLIGGITTLVMVWGIRKGDYGLRKGLAVFLSLYAVLNTLVLVLSALFSGSARPLALVWLGAYTLGLMLCAIGLCRPEIRSWAEVAPQPTETEKKIHFFHGGWRDL